MAEKRMVSKVISISKKFNLKLDDHFCRLLYLMLIPHTDDFGRITGCPHKVRALVIPMLENSWRDVEAALLKLCDADLIKWYEVDDEKYIQINDFEAHQSGLHKRSSSKFPEPPSVSRKFPEVPGSSDNPPEIPLEGKGTELNRTELEGNRTEGNGRELTATDVESQKDHILALINELKYEGYTLHDLDEIYSFIGVVDIEVIEAALKKSTGKHSPVKYSVSALKGMLKEGVTKKEHIFQKPDPGQAPPNVTHINRGGRSGKPKIGIVENKSSEQLSPEEMEEIRAMARRLDGA